MTDAMPVPSDREAAVLDRITAFRRRRPRLTDDVVTLAHGAGGKASAALVENVFLDAFVDGDPGPLPDAATLQLAGGERLAFSTDSFVVQPLRFPGGSIGHLAVHGTVNDLAVQGADPAWLSAAFVIEEGFPMDELRALVADMADAARAAHVEIVTGDTKVVGPRRGRRSVRHDRGCRRHPSGPDARRGAGAAGRRRARVGHHRRPRHGGHARARRPLARERHPFRHRAARRAGRRPPRGCARDAVAPRSDPGWRRDRVQRAGARHRSLGGARRSRSPAAPRGERRVRPPRHRPLDGRQRGQGRRGRRARRDRRRAGGHACASPGRRHAARIGEIVAEPEGIVALRTTFGGTRIVDMLVGDPLPRIC